MPKFLVEIIVSYPCVIEAQTMEEAFTIAEDSDWDSWPDDDPEVIEYCAELVVEDEDGNVVKENNDIPQKTVTKSKPKLTLVKDG